MLHNYIFKNQIFINPNLNNKKELFEFLSKKAKDLGYITSSEEMINAIVEKEKNGVIELKPNITFPHARGNFIKNLFAMIVVAPKGFNYEGAKKNTANIIIFIGIPIENKEYLKLLASISRLMAKDDFVKDLLKAQVEDDIIYTLKKYSYLSEKEIKKENLKKYLVTLSLNRYIENSKIAPLLAEVGIQMAACLEGENIGHSGAFIPFLASFGFTAGIGKSKYNKIYTGITDDKEACSRLFSLLNDAGINLAEPGVGFLYQVEVMESYGGNVEDIDF